MAGLFFNLGKLAGPKIRKAQWAYLAVTAPEAEVIEAEFIVGADMARVVREQFRQCTDHEKTDRRANHVVGQDRGRSRENGPRARPRRDRLLLSRL